jgi:hypothetical protein
LEKNEGSETSFEAPVKKKVMLKVSLKSDHRQLSYGQKWYPLVAKK